MEKQYQFNLKITTVTIKVKRMKSIKEKSNEYAKDYLFSLASQRAPNIHFEEGANYVLDVITDVINQPMNDYLILGELKKVILQLKK